MYVGSSPIFRTNKKDAVGVFFIGAEGERIPFCKGAVCALIKREGGTAKVPPSHIPFLAVVSGGGCVGLLGGRWRGAHGFLQRAGNCPDLTRRGHRKGSPFTHPSPCVGAGLCVLGRGRSFLVPGEGMPFCRFKSICPDGTRKTTLTVFFHAIFPSGGEGFFVGAGRLFYWCAGTKWIFVHKIYDIYLQNE